MWRIRRIITLLLTLALITAAAAAIYHRQYIHDWWRVQQYQPSEDIKQLAARSGMTSEGTFYFYLSHPHLKSATEFNQDCRRVEQGSPILGCFLSDKDQIHIYNVQNPELDGIKEVTAVHEMLHAVWSRLPDAERGRLTTLLEAAYQRKKDAGLTERMAYYERSQPGSRANELHSILGTEFADLGDELEAHYARFFRRPVILDLHQRYHRTFTAAEARSKELLATLRSLKAVIDQQSADYQSRVVAYNRKVASFNQRATQGDFASRAAFDQEKRQLGAERQRLQQQRVTIENHITTYNNHVTTLRDIGTKIERLQQSLDSQKEVR